MGEECDDGNTENDDGCSETCKLEKCGDGIKQINEECDDVMESVTCDSDCTFAACGDGHLNTVAGEKCDDNNKTPADGCSQECQPECLAFVTNNLVTGDMKGVMNPENLMGRLGADAACANAAESANLYGTYKALLSDMKTNATTHALSCNGPFIRRDNMEIAGTPTDLFNIMADLAKSISVNENGGDLATETVKRVWTGTEEDGTVGSHCEDWTSAAMGPNGMAGKLDEVDNTWITNGAVNCSNNFHLYCFQQGE